jgi:hypothetical protein
LVLNCQRVRETTVELMRKARRRGRREGGQERTDRRHAIVRREPLEQLEDTKKANESREPVPMEDEQNPS